MAVSNHHVPDRCHLDRRHRDRDETKPIDVEVATVARAPLDQKVGGDGELACANVTRCRPRSRVRSRESRLHEGDVVEPGTVLARLLPLASPLLNPASRQAAEQHVAAAVDAERQAQATVTRAEAADAEARRELAQMETLAKQSAVPVSQLDQATADSRMRAAELTWLGSPPRSRATESNKRAPRSNGSSPVHAHPTSSRSPRRSTVRCCM